MSPLLLLLACGTDDALLPADHGDGDGWTCEETRTPLAADEATPEGTLPSALIAAVGGERATTLAYDATGATTALTLAVTWTDGAIVWVDGTAAWVGDEPEDSGAPDDAPDCEDRLEVAVTLAFTTADGAFAEALDAVLVGTAAEVGRIDLRVPWEDLAGAYVPTELDPAEWDEVSLAWAVNQSADATGGEIALSANRTGELEDGTAYDEGYEEDMARWPAP